MWETANLALTDPLLGTFPHTFSCVRRSTSSVISINPEIHVLYPYPIENKKMNKFHDGHFLQDLGRVVVSYIHLDDSETNRSSIDLNVKTADSFMRSSIAKLAFYHRLAPHLFHGSF